MVEPEDWTSGFLLAFASDVVDWFMVDAGGWQGQRSFL